MTPQTRYLAVEALRRYRGDDAARARREFRGMNPLEMQAQHGQSGKTRQQILDEYEQHERAVDAAILEIQGV